MENKNNSDGMDVTNNDDDESDNAQEFYEPDESATFPDFSVNQDGKVRRTTRIPGPVRLDGYHLH